LRTRESQPPKLFLKSLKVNGKREKAHLLYILRRRINLILGHLKSSSKEEGNPDHGNIHSKRMSQLKHRLEALTNWKGLQEVGVIRPYPAEWDLVPHPPKFKAPTLQDFDGKGRRTLLRSFVSKGKPPDYYRRTRRSLGYVSTSIPSASESKKSLYHNHSFGTSSWESDVSVGNLFTELSVNIVSASHLEDENKETIQSNTDP